MNKKLTTRQDYDETKAIVEALIAEGTEKGMLEPEIDNEYTRQISDLSKQMAQYEDDYYAYRQTTTFQIRHQC